jgi:hypothetical protein
MDARTIESVCSQIYRRFPVIHGSRPSVRAQGDNTLLIFRGKASTDDGKTLNLVVRAVVDPTGKIIKVSSSR